MHRKVQLIVSGGIRAGLTLRRCARRRAVSIGRPRSWRWVTTAPSTTRRIGKSRPGRLLRRLPGRPRPGRDLDAGRRARAVRPRRGRPQGRQLPPRADARNPDARPCVRQACTCTTSNRKTSSRSPSSPRRWRRSTRRHRLDPGPRATDPRVPAGVGESRPRSFKRKPHARISSVRAVGGLVDCPQTMPS